MSRAGSNHAARHLARNPHRNHDVYIRRVHDLGLQLNGERDWAAGPASNPRDALSKIRALMNDRIDPVFSSLFDDLPESGYLLEDDDVVGVVLEDLDRFSMICEAVCNVADLGPYSDLDDKLYAMWPHALKWLAFFHPGDGRIRPPTTAPNLHLVLTNLALVYLSMFQANRGHAERLFVERPDMLHPVFDLWLHFPRYVPPVARQPEFDPVDTIHNILNVISYMHNLVAGWDHPHVQRRSRKMPINKDDARDLFIRELQRHARGKGGLHVHFAKQNQYLAELPMPPRLADQVWYIHFQLQTEVLNLPMFRLDVSPRSFLRSVVSAGECCIERGMHTYALRAVDIISLVCEAGGNNRTLIRSIEAGAYTLLSNAGEVLKEDRSVAALSHRISLGIAQQSVLRAFHRIHGDRFVSSDKLPGDPTRATYAETVFYNYCYRYTLYAAVCKKGAGLAHMPCSNETGPHVRGGVRVCPCGEGFYCSKECQRKHWRAGHRTNCCAADGPWGLHGLISLGDILYLNVEANLCIRQRPPAVVSGVLEVYRQGRQPIIVIEAIQEYPGTYASVRSFEDDVFAALLADPTEPIHEAFIEVRITLGRTRHARILPFKYDIAYFTKTA
ncbi:hypothetical protein BD626DRAFT_440929 [Schizophyllum amplum]|uniref:MYND-type domain-containing protein n=1 Tax=Schizophyllum amplum TaxID=97359 RepID=A0A550BVC1_9AGAR|nr:hypothetical protein BD626DRAFT_440929 [Auriculariopsis ampla]